MELLQKIMKDDYIGDGAVSTICLDIFEDSEFKPGFNNMYRQFYQFIKTYCSSAGAFFYNKWCCQSW